MNTATEPTTTLFVYGTLMLGFSNARLLTSSKCLGTATTAPRYTLLDLGGFPGLVDGGDTAVRGELYEVTARDLVAVDRLEGHPTFYQRSDIELHDGQRVEAYVLPRERFPRPTVPSGDWRAHVAERQAAMRCERCTDGVDWTGDEPVVCACTKRTSVLRPPILIG